MAAPIVTNALFAGRKGAGPRRIRKGLQQRIHPDCHNLGQLYQNGLGVRNDMACDNLHKPP